MTAGLLPPPFRPPYVLGGSLLAIVGLWDKGGAARETPSGFLPFRLFGRTVGIVIANHYSDPPAEMPVRYREVIAASLARRGTEIAAVPFDMVLDQQLPVDLGRRNYALPKRLDPSFVVEDTTAAFSATARDLELRAHAHGSLASVCALPIRIAFALAVRAITASIDVLGSTYPPARRARIGLRPRGIGHSLRVTVCTSNGVALRSLWCQSWAFSATHLGPPRPIDEEAT